MGINRKTSKVIWNLSCERPRSTPPSPFNKVKRTVNWEEYKQDLTTYNNKIRSAKTNSFRKFCLNVSSTPEAARLHKALARGKTDTALTIKIFDGTYPINADGNGPLVCSLSVDYSGQPNSTNGRT